MQKKAAPESGFSCKKRTVARDVLQRLIKDESLQLLNVMGNP